MVRNSFFRYINGSSILVSGLLLTVFSFLLSGCFKDDNVDELQQQQEEAFYKQLEVDTLLIKQHLAANNITNAKKTANIIWYNDANKTANVIWYTEQVVGTGIQPQVGNRVRVNYTLSLLNGTALENGNYGPFTLGTRAVVDGFDYGIRTMKVGGKSRFYIPSGLGYGTAGSGSKIPPNTILVFDIELLDAL